MKKPSTLNKAPTELTCIEICSGAGGQALGLERAGFESLAHVEYDRHACATLRLNRPNWNVVEGDVRNFSAVEFKGIDLVAGGVPCPPFSKAGRQLGSADERDLFPEALRLVDECRPKAVMLENVRGFLDAVFTDYRMSLKKDPKAMAVDIFSTPPTSACRRRKESLSKEKALALDPFFDLTKECCSIKHSLARIRYDENANTGKSYKTTSKGVA